MHVAVGSRNPVVAVHNDRSHWKNGWGDAPNLLGKRGEVIIEGGIRELLGYQRHHPHQALAGGEVLLRGRLYVFQKLGDEGLIVDWVTPNGPAHVMIAAALGAGLRNRGTCAREVFFLVPLLDLCSDRLKVEGLAPAAGIVVAVFAGRPFNIERGGVDPDKDPHVKVDAARYQGHDVLAKLVRMGLETPQQDPQALMK